MSPGSCASGRAATQRWSAMDERVNCMACFCDDGEGVVRGVATVDGITHALARAGWCWDYLFRLCDFDKIGVLRPGRFPSARVERDPEPAPARRASRGRRSRG